MNKRIELRTPKGTKDNFPIDETLIKKIIQIIEKNFQRFGFLPLDTPTIEYLDLLTYKYNPNDEIISEIFKFKDRGNRDIGLRYDLTTSLCRFIAENYKIIKKPFKRYQWGKVFRDGPLKKGRLREFIQFDGDVVGDINQYIESDLLLLANKTYKDLGLNVIFEINSYKILEGILLAEGYNEEELQNIILSIDKLKKIGEEEIIKELKTKNINIEKIPRILKILKKNSLKLIQERYQKNLKKYKQISEGITELENLIELIKDEIHYKINLSLARGLAIYTGNVWEIYDKKQTITSSIGAGGRYDNIIGEYSNSKEKIQAVGISFGIIPILECLKKKETDNLIDILIVPLFNKETESLKNKTIQKIRKLANNLRNDDYSVDILYSNTTIKKAFDYAESIKSKKIIFIGEKEIKENYYEIKDLDTKEIIHKKFDFNS